MAQRPASAPRGGRIAPGTSRGRGSRVLGLLAVLLVLSGRGVADPPGPTETEPNEDHASASALPLDGIVRGRLDRPGDRDVFRVHVPGRGRLRIVADPLPTDATPALFLEDPDGKEVARLLAAARVRQEMTLETAGERDLFLVVREGPWSPGESGYGHEWDNRASEQAYALRASFVPAPDVGEPNDEPARATALPLPGQAEFTIFPAGDVDHFALDLPADARGVLRLEVEMPDPLAPRVTLQDPEGKVVATREGGAAGRVVLRWAVPSGGRYVVGVADGARGRGEHGYGHEHHNAFATTPGRIVATWSDAADAHEPDGDLAEVAPLPLGSEAQGTLFPAGDADTFRLDVPPGAAWLEVLWSDVPAHVAPTLFLLDAEGREVRRLDAAGGIPVLLREPVLGPARWFVRLADGPHGHGESGYGHEWGNQQDLRPYRLRASVVPVPDANEPNGSRETARPLDLGTPVDGAVFPAGDQDWFRIRVPASGHGLLRVDVTNVPDAVNPILQLFAEDGREVAVRRGADGRDLRLLHPVRGASEWTLLVRDGGHGRGEHGYGHEYDNRASASPYRLTATLVASRAAEGGGEAEPDDDPAQARSLEASGDGTWTGTGSVWPEGDVDTFAFDASPGGWEVTAVGFEPPVAPDLVARDAEGREVARVRSRCLQPDEPLRLRFEAASAGRYVILVQDCGHGRWENGYGHEWGNAASRAAYRISVRPAPESPLAAVPAPPPPGPPPAFSRRDGAIPVALREGRASVEVPLLPGVAEAWFRVPVPGTGRLVADLVDVPGGIDPRLECYDPGAEEPRERADGFTGRRLGEEERCFAEVRPGDLWLRVTDVDPRTVALGGTARLLLRFEPIPTSEEPADAPEAARPFGPDGVAVATTWPAGDEDWFRFLPTEAGTLEVALDGVDPALHLAVDVVREDSRRLQALYVRGGRGDYVVPDRLPEGISWTHATAETLRPPDRRRHLGAREVGGWPAVEGAVRTYRFSLPAPVRDVTFHVRLLDHHLPLLLRVNGAEVGRLLPGPGPSRLAVPAGALRGGENVVEVEPGVDDAGSRDEILLEAPRFTGTTEDGSPWARDLEPFVPVLRREILAGYDVVVLDGLTDAAAFDFDRPEGQAEVLAWVEAGGRFVLLCPQAEVLAHDASAAAGGSLLREPTSYDQGLHARRVIDGGRGRGWATARGAPFPHTFVLGFVGGCTLPVDGVVLWTSAWSPERRPREVEIAVSTESPDAGFRVVGRYEITTPEVRQALRFPPTAARFLRVALLSNHGDPEHTELGEIEVRRVGGGGTYFGVTHEPGWSDAPVAVLDDLDPLASEFAVGSWNGYAASDQNGAFLGASDAGFHVVAAEAGDLSRVVTAVRRIGRGTLVLDAQELGYPGNTAAAWRIPNVVGYSDRRLVSGSGTLRARGADPRGAVERWAVPLREPGPLLVRVRDLAGGFARTPWRLAASVRTRADTGEPDDRRAGARPIEAGRPTSATLDPAGDHDWFRVPVEVPCRLRLSVRGAREDLDPVVEVYAGISAPAPLAVLDGTEGGGRGHGESAVLDVGPGTVLVHVFDRNPRVLSREPYALEAALDPLPRDRSGADASWTDLPVALLPEAPHAVVLDPGGAAEVLEIAPRAGSDVEVRVTDVPALVDPVVEILRVGRLGGRPGAPLRVLHLAGHRGVRLEDLWPEGVQWTRVEADAADARAAADRLGAYDVVILDALRAPTDFGALEAGFADRVRNYVESGGRFVLLAPEVPLSEIAAARGGRLVRQTSQWDDRWSAARLIDGVATPGNPQGTAWCCAGKQTTTPQEMVFEVGGEGPRVLDRVVLYATTQAAAARAKEVQVAVGLAAEGPFEEVGAATLAEHDGPQTVRFAARPARFVRVVVLSNRGHGVETQLGEVEAYGPASPTLFGLRTAQAQGASPVTAPDPTHVLVSGVSPATPEALAALPVAVAFEGSEAEGFVPLLTAPAAGVGDPPLVVAAARSLGRGVLVVDGVPAGVPDLRPRVLRHLENLLGQEAPWRGEHNGTCGGGAGFPEAFRFRAEREGPYLLRLRDATSRGSREPLRIVARYEEDRAAWGPPGILARFPGDGARDVDPTQSLHLALSRPLAADAAREVRITATGTRSGEVRGQVRVDGSRRHLLWTPDRAFSADEDVTLHVAGGLRDDLGRDVAPGASWTWRTSPPPRRGGVRIVVDFERPVLGAAPCAVTLRASAPLAGPPEVRLVAAPVAPEAVLLRETAAGEWRGTLAAPRGAADGFARLEVLARAADGSPVTEIAIPALRIDATPPAAPRPPTLAAGPGGRVIASFGAAPGEDVVRTVLLRASEGAPPVEVGALAGPGPGAIPDPSPGRGRHRYRLATEDAAGNRSAPSAEVAFETTGPGLLRPVTGLAAAARGGGIVVSWTPSDEPGVDGYAIFRRRDTVPFDPLGVPPTGFADARGASFSDRPPDGRHAYFVVARDRRGDLSPLSAPAEVVLDTVPPTGAVVVDPWRRPPGPLEAFLIVSEGLAEAPTLSLQIAGHEALPLALTAAGEGRWRAVLDVPPDVPDGEARFALSARDLAGNPGTWLTSGATVYLDPPPPLRAGTPVRVTLVLHEAVAEAPRLSVTATGIPPEIALVATGDPRRFEGTLSVPEGSPDGVARFSLRARDVFGHEGGRIARSLEVTVGEGPARPLYESPEPPVGSLTWEPGTRPLRLALTTSKSCASVRLGIRFADGSDLEIPMSGSGDRFTGALEIPAGAPDGPATFRFEAEDLTGLRGTRLARGEMMLVSRRAPEPPLDLAAQARADGVVALTWSPPVSTGPIPVPLAGYRVVRTPVAGGAEAVIAERLVALEILDRTPEDAAWRYTVAAISLAGVEGPPGPAVDVRSDRVPPARPPAPALAPAERGTAVRVAFEPVAEAVRYRVHRAADDGPRTPVGETPAPPFVDPAAGGALRYDVVAVDAAGNESPPSETGTIDFASALPVSTVSFDPPPPLTSRGGAVLLRTTRPLVEAPLLVLVGGDGTEVPVPLAGSADEWKGTLPDLAALPAGRASLRVVARAPFEGAVVESALLRGPAEVAVDARPAAFRLTFPGGTPRVGERWILRAGTYEIRLTADEALRGPPRLTFTPAGAERALPIPLEAVGESAFAGRLAIDDATGDGPGLFEVEATDAVGNRGAAFPEGRVAVVRTRTPEALSQVKLVALTRGRVAVAWAPPGDPAVRRFEVFRAGAPPEGGDRPAAVPPQPAHAVERVLLVEDRPGAGRWLYAVRAVDEAGNPGPLSPWAAVEVDLAPPGAPREVVGEVLKGGTIRLAWTAPEGEAPSFYNIYFAEGDVRDPSRARRLNEMYPFLEIYGAPPDDGTFTFFVTAVDAKLNEGPPSPGVRLTVTDRPPIARIRVLDGEGRRVNRPRPAIYDVEVEADQALDGPPTLALVATGAAEPLPVPLVAEGTLWRGRLVVAEDFAEGAACFSFRGRDAEGNEGREILEGECLEVDRTPPRAVREAAAETDTTDRLGAVDVSWKVPEGEVPHGYRVLRRRADAPDAAAEPVAFLQVERVTERYATKDVPAADGRYAYRVEPVDLAGNVGPASPWVEADSRTLVPKASLLVRTAFSRGEAVAAVGVGRVDVRLEASAPLAAVPRLALHVAEARIDVPLEAESGDGLAFRGSFAVTEATPEGEGAFRWEGTDRAGRTGTFLSGGARLTVDRTPAEAEVTIEDCFELRPNRYTGKLERVPARAGDRRVRVSTTKPLAAPPLLEAAPEGSEAWIPVRLGGDVPGSGFGGTLRIPAEGPEGGWRFRLRATDLLGNVSERIAAPRRTFRTEELDDPSATPRILQTFETTGERFTVDVAVPEAPTLTGVEALRLGVLALTWRPGAEKPITYRLYRSLTPIVALGDLVPAHRDIRAETMVDDPPFDARWFWAVTALDAAGNESAPSNALSAVVDSIKPELKIKPVPTPDFVEVEIESESPVVSLSLRFPGGPKQAVLGGDSGELVVEQDPETGRYHHRVRLKPQQLEVFNGQVEIVVHSPDPAGNVVEQTAELALQPLDPATGAVVEAVDQGAVLVVPPGARPVVPSAPERRVSGRRDLVFLRYEHIPRDPRAPKEDPKAPDPLPLELEMVSKPYRVELNQDVQEPLELRAAATQARMPELPKIVFSVSDLADYGGGVEDPEFLKQRIRVVRWTPPEPSTGKKGRWEPVPEIEIDLKTWKVIAPAEKVTSYVVVAETTPPSVRDLEPAPDTVVPVLRPAIACRVVDKGTGVAVGPENRVSLHVDGEAVSAAIDDADPTEVVVRWTPTADLAPGPHVITVYAEDVVENRRTATWRFTVDTAPPDVLEVTPPEDRPIGIPRPIVGVRVLDAGGGVDGAAALLRLDGSPLAARFDADSGWFVALPSAPLASGAHEVEARIPDRGGETAVRRWTFVVDREGPVAASLVPPDGAALREAAEVSAVIVDPAGGLDPESLGLWVDGREVGRGLGGLPGFAWRPEAGHVVWRPLEGLAEGAHDVLLEARDRLGNVGRTRWAFVVDVTAPRLETLVAWRPELKRPLLALGLLDAGSGVGEGGLEVEIGGGSVPRERVRDDGSGRYFVPSPEGAGEGPIVVRARDRAGNVAEQTLGVPAVAGLPERIAAAEAARAAGQLEEAETALRAVLAERPRAVEAANLLAVVLHARGRRPEARALLERTVEENPLARLPLWNLALACEAAGDLPRAVEVLDAYLRLEPEGEWAERARERRARLVSPPQEGGIR